MIRGRGAGAENPFRDVPADGPGPAPAEFLSGTFGRPRGGRAGRLARRAADRALDLRLARAAARLDELAAEAPAADVLVLSIYRGAGGLLPAAVDELRASRHDVRLALGTMDRPAGRLAEATVAEGLTGGKFENLNALLAAAGAEPARWTLVVDDDVMLPRRFLDRLIGLAEHFDLALAQPAQSLASFAAWPVTRRRRGSLLRESRFVEIGPVTLFRRDALDALTPFPPLRYGWGLDVHWAALAAERGWRLGIADALAVRHEEAGVAAAYSSHDAIREARRFLAERPFVDSRAALESRRLL